MKNEVQYLMSQSQLNRHAVIHQVIKGNLGLQEAATALGISKRQVLRLKKGVQQQGAAALIHKNTGRKPAHALDEGLSIILCKHSYSRTQAIEYIQPNDLQNRLKTGLISAPSFESGRSTFS